MSWKEIPLVLRACAQHEAGHAVLAEMLGWRVRQVNLWNGGHAGDCRLFGPPPSPWVDAVVFAAGHAVEKWKHGRVIDEPSQTDRVEAARRYERADTAKGLKAAAWGERARAEEESRDLRDEALQDGPRKLKRAVEARLAAARQSRQAAADAILAAIREHLAVFVRLDHEIDALEAAKPRVAVRKALVSSNPDVFGAGKIADIEPPYDHRSARRLREDVDEYELPVTPLARPFGTDLLRKNGE